MSLTGSALMAENCPCLSVARTSTSPLGGSVTAKNTTYTKKHTVRSQGKAMLAPHFLNKEDIRSLEQFKGQHSDQ